MFNKKIGVKENVEYQLKDQNGNTKQLFKLNKFGKFLNNIGIISPEAKNVLVGSFVDKLVISNLVTNAGMADVAGLINGSGSPASFTYIALGSGSTSADATDTTLETEITTNGGARAEAAVSLVTTDVTDDTAQLVETFSFTGALSITESGVLNAASSGTLLARQVFSTISVANGDSLQITWKFDVDTA
ncbi:MAG: hypothetical protein K9L31_03225 [Candidatus Pacebacteria bacterium]|nr:hypothetical protein [Candidatus Paceibacterota bacterium]